MPRKIIEAGGIRAKWKVLSIMTFFSLKITITPRDKIYFTADW